MMAAASFPDTFLWRAELKVLGRMLRAFKQTLGTCVSQGWGRFAQDLFLIQIMFGSLERWVAPVATEPLYAGSRIEIGKGRLGGNQGSYGAWMAEWVRQWGVVFRLKYGQYDLRTPDDNIAQTWGTSRNGVPAELETESRQHPITYIAPVRSAEEARASICNWRGIPVCSNVGFRNFRDRDGFDYANGTWNHCMYFRGYFLARGNRPAFVCQQSWGNQPIGPNKIFCESGEEVELPEGCFAVDFATVDRMLKQNDSYTGAGAKGFTLQHLKWSLAA
jgi:hypothetical protein